MFCSKCGTALFKGAGFCTVCGQPTGNVSGVGIGAATAAGPMVAAAEAVPPLRVGAPVPVSSEGSAVAAPAWPAPAYVSGVLYAGFWLRVVAAIIDGIVISIPFVPFMFAIFSGMMPMLMTRPPNPQELVFALLPRLALLVVFSQIAGWLYWGLMESSSWQATLGKKALGLYVTDLGGKRATFGRTSGRYCAGRLVSVVPYIGGLYFLVDCICAGLTEKKQAIHDIIAGCLVLRKA
jgi:uncharacterized RDD family membrane protein YckC